MAAEHLVIVGKGGVGKSTTAANLSAALAEGGKRVLLVGYDSCARSSSLRGTEGGEPVPRWNDRPCQDLYPDGHGGTLCLEAGELGPAGEAGEGAALLEHPLVKEFDPHFVVHDVGKGPGGAFVLPAAVEGVARLYVVTSADMAAIHVVNEFFAWLNTIPAVDCRFGGVIANKLSGPLHQSIIAHYVSETNTAIVGTVSHSLRVSASDFYNRTVIEAAPSSQISFSYRKLARHILEGKEVRRPAFLSSDNLTAWAVKWGDIISELETGVVGEGASI